MKRNELFTSTAVANEDTSLISMVQENISEEKSKSDSGLSIPVECLSDFRKAMKIGYYKELHKQGLITNIQLEQLIQLQDKKLIKEAA